MKLIKVLLVISIILSSSLAFGQDDFLGLEIGMNAKQVESKLSKITFSAKETVMGRIDFCDNEGIVVANLKNGKAYEFVVIHKEKITAEESVKELSRIKKMVDGKYGKGEFYVNWKNKNTDMAEKDWARGISNDELELLWKWDGNNWNLELSDQGGQNGNHGVIIFNLKETGGGTKTGKTASERGSEKFSGPHFRKCYWGFTQSQVKNIEGEPRHTKKDELYYSVKLQGLNAFVFYRFYNDKLYDAGYMFSEEHSDKNDYLLDYASIDSKLDEKYGEARMDAKWTNDRFKDDSGRFGLAVASGDLTITKIRETESTKIQHVMSGGDAKVVHILIYQSTAVLELLDKLKVGEASEDDF